MFLSEISIVRFQSDKLQSLGFGGMGSWVGGGFVEHGLGFLIGHPANQMVVGDEAAVHERFTLILRERGHLGLGQAEELASFLRPVLAE
jgi:hypothetical protein